MSTPEKKPRVAITKYDVWRVAREGNLEAFLALLAECSKEEQEQLLNALDDEQDSNVLHCATVHGGEAVVAWLLSDSGGRAAGFKGVLQQAAGGYTAFHLACMHGYLNACSVLTQGCKVENGERDEMLNSTSYSGWNSLHFAAEGRRADVVDWLMSEEGGLGFGFRRENLFALTGDMRSVAHCAAGAGCVDTMIAVLSFCKNDEEKKQLLSTVSQPFKWTPLHHAAYRNQTEMIQWLLSESGGGLAAGFERENLFALSSTLENVLHMTSKIDAFDALVAQCRNSEERMRLFTGLDEHGWTLLFVLARFCRREMISEVFRRYPEEMQLIVDFHDNRGMTVLHRVVILAVDDKSRNEWYEDSESDRAAVVRALLGLEEKKGEEEVVAKMDPNVGLKKREE